MTWAKRRYPNAVAMAVAQDILEALRTACSRLTIAGSLRRQRRDVGDVEILYISLTEERLDPEDLFRAELVTLADEQIADLEAAGILARRRNKLGREAWGMRNKLMVHRDTGIPVDLFATTEACWWNYLVCRTGPAESNMAIAAAARRFGCKWHPYGAGFTDSNGTLYQMDSEVDVFAFVGLPYREPEERS